MSEQKKLNRLEIGIMQNKEDHQHSEVKQYSTGKHPVLEGHSRGRSRSFENTRRSDSRSNSAMRRTPKITHESVEKEISNFF